MTQKPLLWVEVGAYAVRKRFLMWRGLYLMLQLFIPAEVSDPA
jgi:hypothetical protein